MCFNSSVAARALYDSADDFFAFSIRLLTTVPRGEVPIHLHGRPEVFTRTVSGMLRKHVEGPSQSSAASVHRHSHIHSGVWDTTGPPVAKDMAAKRDRSGKLGYGCVIRTYGVREQSNCTSPCAPYRPSMSRAVADSEYYDLLGVPHTATQAQIRSAYKKMAIKWHPDKNPEDKVRAEAMFKRIAEVNLCLRMISLQRRLHLNPTVSGVRSAWGGRVTGQIRPLRQG